MIDKDILQKFIDNSSDYLIGRRVIHFHVWGTNDTDEAIFLAADIARDMWNVKLGELQYDKVVNFADEEIKTVIHLGKDYSPFQYGIRRKDFMQLMTVTCNPNKLIHECYINNVSDYYEVVKIMEKLTKENENS
jgi:hypothetical protein